MLLSLKTAQNEFRVPIAQKDDGSTWESHVSGMMARDYYGLMVVFVLF
jgi:hypothetical protein